MKPTASLSFSATVTRTSLAKALGHVQRIIEKRNTIPILAHVLIEAGPDGLTFRGTDLDIEATETIPATVAQPGAITVPAHLLYDIARKLPDSADVAMTVEDGTLIVRAGRSRFRLQTLPASDFPSLDTGDLPTSFTMKAAAFKHLLDSCKFAISTEETRYYLNGIYLHTQFSSNALNIRAVATDGHRLARIENMAPEGISAMPGIILPRKAVSEVLKLLDDAETVSVALSDKKIRFEIGKVVLTSKLIDGTFPDYQRVIPQGNDKRLVVNKNILSASVDRVSTLSSARGPAINLSIAYGKITLSVNDPDSGSASEEIDAEYDSAPIDIGFNSRYLMDVLANVEGDMVTMKMSDPGSPMLVNGEKDDALYVLMPLRV